MPRLWQAAALAVALAPRAASAAGFSVPDVGAQALGRGGAFVAKADDPTALAHDVAGLAGQRGTSIVASANVSMSSLAFARRGTYPLDGTAWAGTPYPVVHDESAPAVVPLVAVASDLGLSSRVTFALGFFAPSALANRRYPLTIAGKPSPGRYDAVASDAVLVYPTAAVAARVLDGLDVGLAVHGIYGSFDVTSVSSVDLSRALCPTAEAQACDSLSRVQTSGTSAAASVGALAHLGDADVGLAVRSPTALATHGTLSPGAPRALSVPLQPVDAEVDVRLPWDVRAGARWVVRDGARERADAELDVTYEPWSLAQGRGIDVTAAPIGPLPAMRTTIAHGYRDVLSVRAGGAYALSEAMTLRAGAYYDPSVTVPEATRIDFDTLDKIGLTCGVGLRIGSVRLDVGYAEIFDLPRTVDHGAVRPLDVARGGTTVGPDGAPYAAVNEGSYEGHSRIVAVSLGVVFAP